jgi:hypothetical protein
MTINELKDFYEANPESWILIYCEEYGSVYEHWLISDKPYWKAILMNKENDEATLKLIHIRHKQVLEAYLTDNSVWIQHNNAYIVNDFIESYNPNLEYKLKESNMLRCPKCGSATNSRERSPNGSTTCLDCKFYTSNSNWDELLREKEDFDMDEETYEKMNNFQDFGFTADFEGEIYYKSHNKSFGMDCYFGLVGNEPKFWDSEGNCYSGYNGTLCNEYNLTPIKKEWYEQRPLKFPFAVSDTFNIRLVHGYDDLALAIDSGYDKATKEEVMSLYSDSGGCSV